jgi:hypothetical protein
MVRGALFDRAVLKMKPAKHGTDWSDHDVGELRRLLSEDAPTVDIAEALGRSVGAIRDQLNHQGLLRRGFMRPSKIFDGTADLREDNAWRRQCIKDNERFCHAMVDAGYTMSIGKSPVNAVGSSR